MEFLLFLARRVVTQPILLLLTCRSEEIYPGLAHFLAQLNRERHFAEITLSRLTDDEVGALIRAIFHLSRPVRPDFLEAIARLTEGNPFLVTAPTVAHAVANQPPAGVDGFIGIWNRLLDQCAQVSC